MITTVKVRSDGNHLYACFPCAQRPVRGRKSERSWKLDVFDHFYNEALQEKISPRKISSYVEDRIRAERDPSDWLFTEDVNCLYRNKQRNLHKRIQRYEQKLFLTDWNYYVTFTYDSVKETEETFVTRLKRCFSNFKTRHDWRVICVRRIASNVADWKLGLIIRIFRIGSEYLCGKRSITMISVEAILKDT